jgi:UDP-N-acetylglucosamine acyltransferase
MPIHPTAVVDSTAEIHETVEVGPYAIIEADVKIGADSKIFAHGHVSQYATLGQRCQVHPFAVVGHLPQDFKFGGEPSYTNIGDDTIIREHATVHRGTDPGSTTVVGRRCFIMSTGHVGHNCTLGDDVKVANGALLSGHVVAGDKAFVSGNVTVHQFVRLGELTMIGGLTRVNMDLPPFMLMAPHHIEGLNVIGLRRAGFSAAERNELKECFRLLYRASWGFREGVARVAECVQTDPGRRLLAFLQGETKRGFMAHRRRGEGRAAAGSS